jgi:hypothetical protein
MFKKVFVHFDKKCFGPRFGRFFTNSSGHPACVARICFVGPKKLSGRNSR